MAWPGINDKFTPEILAKIPFWVQSGKTREEMAAIVGVTVEVFSSVCSRKQIILKQWAYPPGTHPMFVPVQPKTLDRFRAEAAKRDLKPEQLMAIYLDFIAKDNMFKAMDI